VDDKVADANAGIVIFVAAKLLLPMLQPKMTQQGGQGGQSSSSSLSAPQGQWLTGWRLSFIMVIIAVAIVHSFQSSLPPPAIGRHCLSTSASSPHPFIPVVC